MVGMRLIRSFSALIGVLIVWSSWHLMRDSTNVLLEGTPAHINLAAVEDAILELKEFRTFTTCTFGRSLPDGKL